MGFFLSPQECHSKALWFFLLTVPTQSSVFSGTAWMKYCMAHGDITHQIICL